MIDVETTDGDADAWVAALADPARRDAAFESLVALGACAREAVRAGLGDGRWAVRRLCVLWFWRTADEACAAAVRPLLHDPRSRVRHAVVIALSHTRSKTRSPDVVPLLIERALQDESLRVRRQAVSMLAWEHAHPDLEGFFADRIAHEADETLVKFAREGLHRSREVSR
jgi:HEAT repeat protein